MGQLAFDTTPGGHRRFDIEEVLAQLGRSTSSPLRNREGDEPADGIDTPFVPIPAENVTVVEATLVETGPRPVVAHGSPGEEALWGEELNVV